MPRRVAPPDTPLGDDTFTLEPLGLPFARELDDLALDDDVRRFTLVPSSPQNGFGRAWAEVYEQAWRDGTRAGFAVLSRGDRSFLGMGGFVAIDLDARQGELGYILSRDARGRGIATRAVRLLTEWGFGALELERIELRIDVDNRPSELVAERAGYSRDGVLRSVHVKQGRRADLGVWSRLRGDP